MKKIRMTVAATVAAVAAVLTVGLVAGGPGAVVANADRPFGCC